MDPVFYETLASGDILIDANGTPLVLDIDLPDTLPGGSSQWKDPVFWPADLPGQNNTSGDVRFVLGELAIYAWMGSEWHRIGGGASASWKDPVSSVDDLPEQDNGENDLRYVVSARRVYAWDGTEWKPLADTAGGGGGGSISTVDTPEDLEAISDPTEGDMYYVKSENALYVYVQHTVDKEAVYEWEMLRASSDVRAPVNTPFVWYDTDGDTAGSLLVREVDAAGWANSLGGEDPEWSDSNHPGLFWYQTAPATSGVEEVPGGYEPPREHNDWAGVDARREDQTFALGEDFSVESVVSILSADWVSVATTAGSLEAGGRYLYAELARDTGVLSLFWVTGEDNSRTELGSVQLGIPAPGENVSIYLGRARSKVTVRGSYGPADGGSENWVTQEFVWTDGTDFFVLDLLDAVETHPGIAAKWTQTQSFRFVAAYHYAHNIRRELHLWLYEAGQTSPSQEILMADSKDGWLLGGGGASDGPPHVVEQADGADLPQRRALRPVTPVEEDWVSLYTQDDAPNDATRIGVSLDTSKFQNSVDAQVVKTQGTKTGFKALQLGNDFSHVSIQDDEDLPGWRYVASYSYDDGWINFRGAVGSSIAGAGVIGQLDESFCPPHTVMGLGVRDDGLPFSVRIEADGFIHANNVQVGLNYLDGIRFYSGKGFVAIIGTFIPDPVNPYYAVSKNSGGEKQVHLVGAGIFEYPRESDKGYVELPEFPPHTPGYTGWSLGPQSAVQWEVIDGPDQGLTGTINFGTSPGDVSSVGIEIPSGLRGQVRVTFVSFIWYEYFVT